jgi:hypothetical protein
MKNILLLLLFLNLSFATQLATIDNITGKVKVLKSDAIRATNAKVSQELYKNDLLITYKNSMSTIKLKDGSLVTLDEKTKLRVEDLQKLKQEEGQVFFNIETQGSKSLQVSTNFATIGVKGTKFIINSDTNKSVALKSGLVSVEALEGEFELHRKKERKMTDFEVYQMAHDYEYQQYKTKLEEEFIEFKKQFDLQPNKFVSFDGNVVKENTINTNIEKEFTRFENFQK